MAFSEKQEFGGIKIFFARRRYGTKTFTWLHFFDGRTWQEYGDPWQSIVIPREQLNLAIADIKANRMAKDGN